MSARGFTLIEVLVASVVIAVAFTGITQAFVLASRSTIHARDTTCATLLAAQKIEELRASAGALSAGDDAEEVDARGLPIAGERPATTGYRRRWTIQPLPDGPAASFVVAVTVSRIGNADDHLAQLVTIITRLAS